MFKVFISSKIIEITVMGNNIHTATRSGKFLAFRSRFLIAMRLVRKRFVVLFLFLHVWLAAELTHKMSRIGLQMRFLLGMAILSLRLVTIKLVGLVNILYSPASQLIAVTLHTRKYFFKRIIIRDIPIRL